MKHKYLTEPCSPYNMRRPGQRDPISVYEILGRLGPRKVEDLAMALAIHRPDIFEERILEWARSNKG